LEQGIEEQKYSVSVLTEQGPKVSALGLSRRNKGNAVIPQNGVA